MVAFVTALGFKDSGRTDHARHWIQSGDERFQVVTRVASERHEMTLKWQASLSPRDIVVRGELSYATHIHTYKAVASNPNSKCCAFSNAVQWPNIEVKMDLNA